ncbi:MAG: hypothetical protein M0P94_04160 [Candidatus Absconditabacterales bacterium]|nr:hypothetical protein [Candidatus Absconditabacterales bacterium]
MSVSLWMVPVFLAVRVTLGKKGLDEFINNNQNRIESNIRFESDLISFVKKSGFNIEKVGRSYKTEIPSLKTFFFWDKILGKYYASFSVYDDENLIKDVLLKIEKSCGRKLFDTNTNVGEFLSRKSRYITEFRDKDILVDSLKKFRLNPYDFNDYSFKCRTGNIVLGFEKAENGPYFLVFEKDEDIKEVYTVFKMIDDDYRKNVQNISYKNVKSKLVESGYKIENEEKNIDNTIIITINVG